MKVYQEEKQGTSFNWNEFLNKKKYTEEEVEEGVNLAGDWTTCACANQCAIIPRDGDGEPYDQKLSRLGGKFASDVERIEIAVLSNKNVKYAQKIAKNTLAKIEVRSGELIRQELKDRIDLIEQYGFKVVNNVKKKKINYGKTRKRNNTSR